MKRLMHIIESFTTSLTQTMSVDEVCWELTKKVIAHVGFEDCVVYLFDEKRGVLVQVAAHGPKNPIDLDIYEPITIEPGKGIVGTTFECGTAQIIPDTRLDARYILDDQMRLSEIAVPIMSEGRPMGVIDSEHSQVDFYTEEHLVMLSTLAAIASTKIVQIRALDEIARSNRSLQKRSEELQHKNAELELLNSQLDEIIYSITHDFRSPVLAAIGLADMIHANPSSHIDSFPMLSASMHKLDGILQGIHLYYQNKRKPIEIVLFRPCELVQNVYETLHHTNKQSFHFNNQVDPNLSVESDKFRFRLIIRQLLQNAFHYGFLDRQVNAISVSAYTENMHLVIEVSDNGPGIPESLLLNNQSMLKRGNVNSTGLGIGMAMMREAAQKMNGAIIFENTRPRGMRARLMLHSAI
jgi:signal transduction histidine kinase